MRATMPSTAADAIETPIPASSGRLASRLSGQPMIQELVQPVADRDIDDLAGLLVDAVESGASVSFLPPLSLELARAWWREATSTAARGAIFLVGRDAEGIVGAVQLHPAWAPNQPHRAEITKLLVHRRARRNGLGGELMRAVEDRARSAGFTLLTLDTKRGDAAEALYRRAGWICAGVIPGYALDPDGTLCDTVIFYKHLDGASRPPGG